MKILKNLLILSAISLFTSCATYSKKEVDQQLSLFNGLTLQQLIALWGVPNRQFEANGQQFVEWQKQEDDSTQSRMSIGSGTGGRGSFFGIGVSFPLSSEPDTCQLRATTDSEKSRILNLQWQGDRNYCGEFLKQTANPKK